MAQNSVVLGRGHAHPATCAHTILIPTAYAARQATPETHTPVPMRIPRKAALRARLHKLLGIQPRAASRFQPYYSAEEQAILQRAKPLTMTSNERLVALMDAVSYVVTRGISGAFAECGVWRGGSVLAMVLRLQQLGVNDRDIYLFDTFEGMTEPTATDTSRFDGSAMQIWQAAWAAGTRPWDKWFNAGQFNLDDVRRTLLATGYPVERLHFVRGKVEDTIPQQAPPSLALLRLDTDWYESTKHELTELWPRLQDGGVLIIDDYGHWDGCRKAVDEFFSEQTSILLNRIDYSGRIGVKA